MLHCRDYIYFVYMLFWLFQMVSKGSREIAYYRKWSRNETKKNSAWNYIKRLRYTWKRFCRRAFKNHTDYSSSVEELDERTSLISLEVKTIDWILLFFILAIRFLSILMIMVHRMTKRNTMYKLLCWWLTFILSRIHYF